MAVTNDTKTTWLGLGKAVIYLVIAAAVYFFKFPADTAEAIKQAVEPTQSAGAILIALLGFFDAIKGYFTNKPDSTTTTTEVGK